MTTEEETGMRYFEDGRSRLGVKVSGTVLKKDRREDLPRNAGVSESWEKQGMIVL